MEMCYEATGNERTSHVSNIWVLHATTEPTKREICHRQLYRKGALKAAAARPGPEPRWPGGRRRTCQGVHELRRLHLVQVRCPVPGRRHRLLPPDQPVGGHHHSLVTLQRSQRRPDGRTVAGRVSVRVGLIFIRALDLVLATYLLWKARAERQP